MSYYQFVFYECIAHDNIHYTTQTEMLKLLKAYEMPAYLILETVKCYGWQTTLRYESIEYETLLEAVVHYRDVLDMSKIESTPNFYKNGKFITDSTTLYNNYIK